jgi:hypothetical protein
MGQQLHPIADAQYRHPLLQHIARQVRRARSIDAGGTSREDKTPGVKRQHVLGWGVPRKKLAVDVGLTDTPGNKLGVLGTKVENGDGVYGLPPHSRTILPALISVTTASETMGTPR